MNLLLIALGSVICTISATWNFSKNKSAMNSFMKSFCIIVGISLMVLGSWLVGYEAGVQDGIKISEEKEVVDMLQTFRDKSDDLTNTDTIIVYKER